MASEACCKPAPPAEHTNQGKYGTIGGLKAYLNKPASATKAVILTGDIFGCDSPLIRKLADKVAASGFYAVVPEYLEGDPYVPTDPANVFGSVGPWLAKHHPDASVDVTKTIVKELKEQGIQSVGLSGFCWGGRLAAMLAKEESVLKAVVLCHPSLVTKENIEEFKIPTAILAAEKDDHIPPRVTEEFKKILESKPIPSFVKIFDGQSHGWTNRYDVNNPFEVKGAEEAQEDMLEFYKKHL